MERIDAIGLAVTAAIGLLIVIISIILMCGKGSNLIAGFNTMPKSEKEKYDAKALSKFVGGILFPIGLLMPVIAIGSIYSIKWLPILYGVITAILLIFALIYANTGNRFRKK